MYYSHIPPWIRERNDMERERAIRAAAPPPSSATEERERALLQKLIKQGNFYGREAYFTNNGRHYRGTVLRADVLTGRVTMEESELGIALFAWPSSLEFFSH